MDDKDLAQIQTMISDGIKAAIPVIVNSCKAQIPPAAPVYQQQQRSYAEVGSPEFAEDRTQINSLNNKFIAASEFTRWNTEWSRNLSQHDQLFSHAIDALAENNSLAKKLNNAYFSGIEDTRRYQATLQSQTVRHMDDSAYVTRYDLSNPNTLGTSDNLRAGSIPANRAIDAGTAQSVLNNTTVQTAIESALASALGEALPGFTTAAINAINGTIPTLEASVGAAIAAALANTPNNAAGNKPASA